MLAELIRVERARRRVTQGELAEMLNISQASLSRIEDGGPVRDARLFIKLSDFLKLSIEDVVNAAAGKQTLDPNSTPYNSSDSLENTEQTRESVGLSTTTA